MNGATIDMTRGKPLSLIFKFAVPLFAGNILQQCYNIVDSFVVGKFIGDEALAAVGSSGIIVFLLFSLFGGIGLGATILISQYFGAGENEKIRKLIGTMYVGMLAASVAVAALGIAVSPWALRAMNTPQGRIFDMSRSYLNTLFVGIVATFGYNLNAGILQGVGDSRTSLLFLAIATVLNTVMDVVFVAAFHWGVSGVAIATVLAQLFSFLFGIWFINSRHKTLRISRREMRFEPRLFCDAVKIGLPAGVQNALFSMGSIALQRLVYGKGVIFMAGYIAVNKLDTFAYMPILSFSNAITTYVGQNFGAKKLDRISRGVFETLAASAVLTVAMSVFVMSCGGRLVGLFSSDPAVIEVGIQYFNRLMPPYILLSCLMILNSAIRGTGESFLPLCFSVTSMLVLRIPAAYILDAIFGGYEMFWCYGIGWIFGNILAASYFVSGKWKRNIRCDELPL